MITVNERTCPVASAQDLGGLPTCFRPNDGDEVMACIHVVSYTEWHDHAWGSGDNLGCATGDHPAKIDPDAWRA